MNIIDRYNAARDAERAAFDASPEGAAARALANDPHIARWNECVRRANERIEALEQAGFSVKARRCIHGVEIEFSRFAGDPPAFEIVTPRNG